MSEFGSSKSFSSVSEPSSSQPSSSDGPPPDPSSSHSSGSSEPSSSEEVHDCIRCGTHCYSDKSFVRLSISRPSLAASYINADCEAWTGGESEFVPGFVPEIVDVDIPFKEKSGDTVHWEKVVGTEPTTFGDPAQVIYHATRSCVTGRWNVWMEYKYMVQDGEFEFLAAADLGITAVGGFTEPFWCEEHGMPDVPTGDGCGMAGAVTIEFTGTQVGEWGYGLGSIDLAVHNNPCCVGDDNDCWQHFNGDCRGRCDEEPSSGGGSESSSSEGGNPLP